MKTETEMKTEAETEAEAGAEMDLVGHLHWCSERHYLNLRAATNISNKEVIELHCKKNLRIQSEIVWIGANNFSSLSTEAHKIREDLAELDKTERM